MLLRGHAIAGTLRLKPAAATVLRPRPPPRSAAAFCTQPKKMETRQEPNKNKGDVMSNSFGEGYSTRSDEEGFGGVYSGNQTLRKDKNPTPDDQVHENHPDYDRSQGSQVAEKEEARNQPMAH